MLPPEKVTASFVTDSTLFLAAFASFLRSTFRGLWNDLGGKEENGDEF
jgi:hypothetical protein